MVENELKFIGTQKADKENPFLNSIYAYYLKENEFYDSIDDINEKCKTSPIYANKFINKLQLCEFVEIKEPSKLQVDEGLIDIGIGTLIAIKVTYSELYSANYDFNSVIGEINEAMETIITNI